MRHLLAGLCGLLLVGALTGCGVTITTSGSSNGPPLSTPGSSATTPGSASSVPSSSPGPDFASSASNSPTPSASSSVAAAPSSWTSDQWLSVLSSDESSVVRISTYTNFLGTAGVTGSGFFTDGYIITCDHVVNQSHYYIDVWLHGGAGPYHAHIVAQDPAQDLAALQLDDGYDPGDLTLGSMANQTIDEPVAIMGHPGGGSLYITPGTLTSTNASIDVTGYGILSPMLQMQAAAIGGDSGGPVFDTKGNVIGVLEDGTAQVAAQGGAVPVSAVIEFLTTSGLMSSGAS